MYRGVMDIKDKQNGKSRELRQFPANTVNVTSTTLARPRLKILYIYPALNRGSGGEMHPMELARCLDRDKFEFAVCLIESASASNIEKLRRQGCALYILNLSRRLYNPVGLIRIIYRVYRLCSWLRPDIVQTHGLHANLLARPAAKWAGVPAIIATETALPDIERNPWRRAFNLPLHGLNRLLDRSTHRIVVVSERVRRWKDRKGRSQKICVITPPFRLDAFQSGRPQEPGVRQGRGSVLGVVGRLSAEKGHRFLIAAMPEILTQEPQAQLLVVGSGALERKLRAQVEALGLTGRVHFLGYMPDVQSAFHRMDVLVVPSLSDAFPLVTIEAMVMGLPVVASRTGGLPEIVLHGKTGLLVPPGASTELAAACLYLLRRPDVAIQMGLRGRERALAEFHPAQFIARHEALYAGAAVDRAGEK
jgi:glycosyltransferase involved in cell wall biosynthesis